MVWAYVLIFFGILITLPIIYNVIDKRRNKKYFRDFKIWTENQLLDFNIEQLEKNFTSAGDIKFYLTENDKKRNEGYNVYIAGDKNKDFYIAAYCTYHALINFKNIIWCAGVRINIEKFKNDLEKIIPIKKRESVTGKNDEINGFGLTKKDFKKLFNHYQLKNPYGYLKIKRISLLKFRDLYLPEKFSIEDDYLFLYGKNKIETERMYEEIIKFLNKIKLIYN